MSEIYEAAVEIREAIKHLAHCIENLSPTLPPPTRANTTLYTEREQQGENEPWRTVRLEEVATVSGRRFLLTFQVGAYWEGEAEINTEQLLSPGCSQAEALRAAISMYDRFPLTEYMTDSDGTLRFRPKRDEE